jgi:hypothetical protein
MAYTILDTTNITGVATATSFVKSGGTSSQYLMADGSVTTSSGGSSPWSTVTNGISYTAGNVGIGTSPSPSIDLKVGAQGFYSEGNAKIGGILDVSDKLSANNGLGSSGQYLFLNLSGYPEWTTLTIPGGSLSIGANATDVFSASSSTLSGVDADANKLMYWDNTNNKLTYLGIGTNLSISSGNLNASGGSGGGDITAVTAGDGLTGGGTSGAVTLAANVGSGLTISSDKIVPDSTVVRTSGNQTITGTKAFTDIIDLNGNGGNGGKIKDYSGSQGASGQALTSRASGGVEWKTITTGSSIWTQGSSTVYINSSDKLGVNTSSPDAWIEVSKKTSSGLTPTLLLTSSDLAYSSVNDNFMTYKSKISSGATVFWHHGHDVSQNKFIINYSTTTTPFGPTTANFTLTTAGNLVLEGTCTADNFILTSDERLKTDIRDVDYSHHIKVDWKTFKMKDKDNGTRYGVIAQELESVHPEFVDTNEEGYKSVKYIDLLVAKIAELEYRLEQLEK